MKGKSVGNKCYPLPLVQFVQSRGHRETHLLHATRWTNVTIGHGQARSPRDKSPSPVEYLQEVKRGALFSLHVDTMTGAVYFATIGQIKYP